MGFAGCCKGCETHCQADGQRLDPDHSKHASTNVDTILVGCQFSQPKHIRNLTFTTGNAASMQQFWPSTAIRPALAG